MYSSRFVADFILLETKSLLCKQELGCRSSKVNKKPLCRTVGLQVHHNDGDVERVSQEKEDSKKSYFTLLKKEVLRHLKSRVASRFSTSRLVVIEKSFISLDVEQSVILEFSHSLYRYESFNCHIGGQFSHC